MTICNSQFSINDIDRWMVTKIDKITLRVALKVSTTWKQQLMAIATATTTTVTKNIIAIYIRVYYNSQNCNQQLYRSNQKIATKLIDDQKYEMANRKSFYCSYWFMVQITFICITTRTRFAPIWHYRYKISVWYECTSFGIAVSGLYYFPWSK